MTKYPVLEIKETMARATARDLPISTKQAIEICSNIRHLDIESAKRRLNKAIEMKNPIKFTRFTNGLGHKAGNMAAGRYPIKACKEILKLLNQAEANAQNKGLGETKVTHISANKASTPMKYGRQSRRQAKRTHVQIVLEEVDKKTTKPKQKNKTQSSKKTEPAKKEVKETPKTQTPKKTEKKETPKAQTKQTQTPKTQTKTTKKVETKK